jgi:hypothetical protein
MKNNQKNKLTVGHSISPLVEENTTINNEGDLTNIKDPLIKFNSKAKINNPELILLNLLKKLIIPSSSKSLRVQGGSINQSYLYNYNKSNQIKNSKIINYITHILNHFFATFFAIINKPVYLFTQNKLTININYYMPRSRRKLITRHI